MEYMSGSLVHHYAASMPLSSIGCRQPDLKGYLQLKVSTHKCSFALVVGVGNTDAYSSQSLINNMSVTFISEQLSHIGNLL